MTDYRRLDSNELIQWGDEFWHNDGTWHAVDSKAVALSLVGRPAHSLIVRRQVELMNQNPTTEELTSLPYPYKTTSDLRLPKADSRSPIADGR